MNFKEIIRNNREFISTKHAAALSTYTSDYVGQLARDGYIDSFKEAKERFVDKEQFLIYANEQGKLKEGVRPVPSKVQVDTCVQADSRKAKNSVPSDIFTQEKPETTRIAARVFNLFEAHYAQRNRASGSLLRSPLKYEVDNVEHPLLPSLKKAPYLAKKQVLNTVVRNKGNLIHVQENTLSMLLSRALSEKNKEKVSLHVPKENNSAFSPRYLKPVVKVGGEVKAPISVVKSYIIEDSPEIELNSKDIHIASTQKTEDNTHYVKDTSLIYKNDEAEGFFTYGRQDTETCEQRLPVQTSRNRIVVYKSPSLSIKDNVVKFVQQQSTFVKVIGFTTPIAALVLVLTSFNIFENFENITPIASSASSVEETFLNEISQSTRTGVLYINSKLDLLANIIQARFSIRD
jgi:hypothetical protein